MTRRNIRPARLWVGSACSAEVGSAILARNREKRRSSDFDQCSGEGAEDVFSSLELLFEGRKLLDGIGGKIFLNRGDFFEAGLLDSGRQPLGLLLQVPRAHRLQCDLALPSLVPAVRVF